MDTGEMVALMAGAGVGLGATVVLLGMSGREEKPPAAARPVTDSPIDRFVNFVAPATGPYARERRQAIAIGAPIVGAGVWLVSGLPLFGIMAALAVVLLPAFVLPDTSRKEQTARLQALDAWIRGVAARIRAGIGLDQALSVSSRDVSIIEPQLRRMAAAISAGLPTSLAIRAFAEEMADGTYDFACQKLILVSGRSVEGLSDALDSLAEAIGKQVRARQEIEVDRAKPLTSARWVTIIGVAMFVFIPLELHSFMHPYRTAKGQVIFCFLVAAALGLLFWARSMAQMPPEPRLFGEQAAKNPARQSEFFGLGGDT